MTLFTSLKQFDAFSKTQQEFQIRTTTGAVVTIVSLFFASILFIMELTYYLSSSVQTELLVDTARNQKLLINLNVTFHNIPCSFLTVDAMDVSGAQQHNILHQMFKQRLTLDGRPIDLGETLVPNQKNGTKEGAPVSDGHGHGHGHGHEEKAQVTTQSTELAVPDANKCGSCYGAESPEHRCCNTCDEVRAAYRKKGWRVDAQSMSTMEQCKDEAKLRMPGSADSEGCLIYGGIEVNKVGGNVHIAPGHTFKEAHGHVHDMQDLAGVKLNTSHTIHHLSFGKDYPDRVNALDGVKAVANYDWTMFQYHIKIVPTVYVPLEGETVFTNQYSATVNQKMQENSMEKNLPGVFFMYDFSPMTVKYSEHRRSLVHFLTSTCAIVGGVVTVAGLVDSLLYHSGKAIAKAREGKAT